MFKPTCPVVMLWTLQHEAKSNQRDSAETVLLSTQWRSAFMFLPQLPSAIEPPIHLTLDTLQLPLLVLLQKISEEAFLLLPLPLLALLPLTPPSLRRLQLASEKGSRTISCKTTTNQTQKKTVVSSLQEIGSASRV